MDKIVMGRAERSQVVGRVVTAVGDVMNMMHMQPTAFGAASAVFVAKGALPAITCLHGMLLGRG